MQSLPHPIRAKHNWAMRRTAASLSLVTLLISGCGHDQELGGPQVAGWSLVDPAQRHPIVVSQQPQTMQVHVARNSRGLSPSQRAELLHFADLSRASDAGNSRLVISAPASGSNDIASMYAVSEIRQILGDHGFQDSSIAVEAYRGSDRQAQPIKITYLRYVAEGPVCGTWPTNLAREPNNVPYPNFGCASQHNLAAMVANPADLLGPRTESDRPSERRDVAWDKYVRGESSASQKSDDEKIKTTAK